MKRLAAKSGVIRRRSLLAGTTLPWLFAPALAAPAPVDAAQFFRDEETLSAHVSPDGKRIALRTVAKHRGVMLSVLDLDSMKPLVLHSQEGADACEVSWVNSARLIFSIEERSVPEGRLDSGPGLFAINADGTAFRQLVERQGDLKLEKIDGGGISGAVPTGAAPKGGGPAPAGADGMGFKQVADAPNIKNLREVESDRLQPWNTFTLSLTESTSTDSLLMRRTLTGKTAVLEVLQLNVRTGRARSLDVPGDLVSAYADDAGDFRAAIVKQGPRQQVIWRDLVTSQWRSLPDCTPEAEKDWAIKHIDAHGTLYVSARRGRDTLALWSYDVHAARWSVAPHAQSPQFDVDATVLVNRGKVVGFRFTIDAEVTQWLDADFKNIQEQLDKLLPRTVNRIAVPAGAMPQSVLVEAYSDTQPTVFLLFNRETQKLARAGSLRPDIASRDMAGVELQRFAARDGLEIPVWVTRPKGTAQKLLPTVVWLKDALYPHTDQWRWDAAIQFLAARGYVVLRPELRGTWGLGQRHHQAGIGQFGAGISSDIAATVQWAIAQGISDPRRIAVAGSGFGAGAGLMAMASRPQFLRCAVVWAAVTDLTGQSETGIAATELASRSPIGQANAITGPVLLAHGDKDLMAPMVKAEAFHKAVKLSSTASEWLVYRDEGHILRDPVNIADFYNRMARFLDSHLST